MYTNNKGAVLFYKLKTLWILQMKLSICNIVHLLYSISQYIFFFKSVPYADHNKKVTVF